MFVKTVKITLFTFFMLFFFSCNKTNTKDNRSIKFSPLYKGRDIQHLAYWKPVRTEIPQMEYVVLISFIYSWFILFAYNLFSGAVSGLDFVALNVND